MKTAKINRLYFLLGFMFVALFSFARAPIARAESAYFSINSSEIFLSGSKVNFTLESLQTPSIEFRLYRIDDPAAFFIMQRDFHSPVAENSPKFTKAPKDIKKSAGNLVYILKTRYRNIFRTLLKQDMRKNFAASYGIQQQKEIVHFVKFPVLKQYTLLKQWTHKPRKKQGDEYYVHETIAMPVTEKGVYLVEAIHENFIAYTAVLVSDIRFIAKETAAQQTLFVCNATTGKPVSGADVTFLEDVKNSNAVARTVKTSADGMAVMDKKEAGKSYKFLIQKDRNFLLSDPYSYSWSMEKYKIYVYTDRPVYRPGHTVHFKAILREKHENNFSVPASREVTVAVTDPRDNTLMEKKVKTNDSGTLEDSVILPEEPPTGRYSIQVKLNEDVYDYGYFSVEEYRKPEFKITLDPDKKSYVSGDTVKTRVSARYYFGEPVKDAAVSYFIYKSAYYKPWWQDYEYGWYFAGDDEASYYDFQLYDKGEGALDENGGFSFAFKSDNKGEDLIYKVVAKISDKSRHEVEGSSLVMVAQGMFDISMETDKYGYTKGDSIKLSLKTQDILGNLMAQSVHISAVNVQYEWKQVKDAHHKHKLAWKWFRKETPVFKRDVETETPTNVIMEIPAADNGEMEITAVSKDARGNVIKRSEYVYVMDSRYSFYESTKDVKLSADKKVYHAGDTAKVLVTLPAKNVTLFAGVEGDALYEKRVLSVEGYSAVLEFPLKDVYMPNVFVKVHFVLNGKFYEGTQELIIPPDEKFLNIDIKTDSENYKPGEKVKVHVSVTDARHHPVAAEVSLCIVDESIYAIKKETTPDIRKFFYGKRWNQVDTQYSYDFYFSGYSVERDTKMAKAKSDALSWADVKGKKGVTVRKKFLDTMYWNAMLQTGNDGTLNVEIPTPDNLTTWRITARAVTQDTQAGETTKTFITRKSLLVRLALPRFFRERDHITFQTIVHNYLKSGKKVHVTLEADGIKINEKLHQTLFLPEGKDKALQWTATVLPAENVMLRAFAETNEESDAMELTLPVLPHGFLNTRTFSFSSGKKQWRKSLPLNFPRNAVKNTKALTVSVAPSLMGPVYASLDYLVHYPYGCTEQTMSSFLPAVLVNRLVKQLKVPLDEKIKKRLPDVLYKGLNRLSEYQHGDGGWGWWENDETDTGMTAYVVYGLSLAKKSGFPVNEDMLSSGISAVTELLKAEDMDLTMRLYILYALSLSGNKDASMILKIYDDAKTWKKENGYGLALLALTLKNMNQRREARAVVKALLKKAVYKGKFMYWKSPRPVYYWEDDTVEMTAFALKAVVGAYPRSASAEKIMAYLMSQRQGHEWKSTKDTSAVLFALVDYIKSTGELDSDFTADITLNGRLLKTVSFKRGDAFKEGVEMQLSVRDMKNINSLRIAKNGNGKLYVSASQSYYTSEEHIKPHGNNFTVTRGYYILQPAKKSDGSWSYNARLLSPSTDLHSGDEILVKVSVRAKEDNQYFMLEDFFPSGFEPVKDTQGYDINGFEYYDGLEDDEWSYFWSHQDVRDEKISFFVTYLPKGEQTFTYIMRAEASGTFHVMPAQAMLMYYPDTLSTSSENIVKVVDKSAD